ncbi:MAG: hypothetical protein HC923_02990 [Myxococcales bacterium]|nr:hypothetical protein [Myxococcales bacterium]
MSRGESSAYRWLVDAHDGSEAFRRGRRGSSISIALVRDESVVLGVVCAPCPPVGKEDLIRWVEGGPILRNGLEVKTSWPSVLERYDVVLVPEDGDEKPTAYAAGVAPARFLSVPSAAYRLALTAVGEGVAAVLHGDVSLLQVAAAHGIVKAAGGTLRNQKGVEPGYGRAVNSASTYGSVVAGGGPDVVRALLEAPWTRITGAPREDLPFVSSRPDRVEKDATRLDRAQGVMLGQLIGDALGAQVEFKNAKSISDSFPDGVRTLRDGGPFNTLAGQPTDDSEMAVGMARAIVEAGGYSAEGAAQAYVDWYRSFPFDMGNTVRTACRAGSLALRESRSVPDAMRAAALADSQANGALMRIAPLAIFGHRSVERAVADAIEDARLTHPNSVCRAANAAFVAALVDGLNGGDPPSMRAAAESRGRGCYEEAEPVSSVSSSRGRRRRSSTKRIGDGYCMRFRTRSSSFFTPTPSKRASFERWEEGATRTRTGLSRARSLEPGTARREFLPTGESRY